LPHIGIADVDKDRRVRPPEIIEVTRWVKQVFKNPQEIVEGGDGVAFSAINNATTKKRKSMVRRFFVAGVATQTNRRKARARTNPPAASGTNAPLVR